jgi:hypothetical protein
MEERSCKYVYSPPPSPPPTLKKNLAKIFLINHKIWKISGVNLIYEEGEKDFLCHQERRKIFVIN